MISTENGRSMIEMLGVLAIIGVLSVGGIAGYSKAMMKYRINKTIEQITLIAGNVRSFFGPQKNYDGISNSTILRKAKIIPDEMIEYNTGGSFKQFTNVFGESVNLATARKSTNADNKAFYMSYTMPANEEICIELLSQDWSNANVTGLNLYYPGSGQYITPPVDVDDVVTKCSNVVQAVLSGSGPHVFWLNIYFDVNSNCWSKTGGNVCS